MHVLCNLEPRGWCKFGVVDILLAATSSHSQDSCSFSCDSDNNGKHLLCVKHRPKSFTEIISFLMIL